MCAVALTGVIVLQGGRLWAESEEQEEEDAESAANDKLTKDGDDSIEPRHYHSEAEPAPQRPGSIRKKGTTGRRAGSRRAAER